jgi:hypothetical protein
MQVSCVVTVLDRCASEPRQLAVWIVHTWKFEACQFVSIALVMQIHGRGSLAMPWHLIVLCTESARQTKWPIGPSKSWAVTASLATPENTKSSDSGGTPSCCKLVLDHRVASQEHGLRSTQTQSAP